MHGDGIGISNLAHDGRYNPVARLKLSRGSALG